MKERMVDRYVETTKKGWFSRIGDSLGGALIGLLLFLIAFPVLFWNEGRAVRRAQDLEYGKEIVVTVRPEAADPENQGKLVHVSAAATAPKRPVDKAFGVSADALKMRRKVEMYQWKQDSHSTTKDKVGGGTETKTEYTYDKVWSETRIDSASFKVRAGHENPGSMPYESVTIVAPMVKLGGFDVDGSLVDELSADTRLDVTTPKLPPGGQLVGGQIYIGAAPSTPRVGDVRIDYFVAPTGTITVVGQQAGTTLSSYTDKVMNDPVGLIERGKKSADEMFKQAQEENYILTWILRFVGFLLMFVGLRLAARPLSVIGSFIPFVGKVIGFGTGLIAFFVALAFSAITIAVAWVFYRPILAAVLIAGAVAAIVIAVVIARKMSSD